MSQWLENYAHHVDLNAWILVLELAIIRLLCTDHPLYINLRGSVDVPVNALRTE
jgi:hypothetical protein